MTTSGDLLRMLEPAIRPTPTTGASPIPKQVPFEQQPFEKLLQEAEMNVTRTTPTSDPAATEAAPARKPSPLAPLSQVDAITNASLRSIVEGTGARSDGRS